ncbi:uncharacterized protein LOC129981787 [Argiope bruennichi]|uniref:MRN complex-interacting protein like n=1 Tax=Argiope bruennichi TaxID=94029 RepID=A0A8T0G1M4_ARGBR|nr:uncharacterized protein LOC129981787 [Argiope bruennichi]XP_055948781.1 uncharacterized protein LOC129981787 [Argiope bruennichi]KAF8797257.1 MRN complex-interacting protein like [Argiope bruennichi]
MPQDFQILRCCDCKKFQVHHMKKAKKWQCKACGLKQSLKRAFFIGSSRDCRVNVQKLNFQAGELEMKRQVGESCYSMNIQDDKPSLESLYQDFDFSIENYWSDKNDVINENDWFDKDDEIDENDWSDENPSEILDSLYNGSSQNDSKYDLPRKKIRCESSEYETIKEDINSMNMNRDKEDQRVFLFPSAFKNKQNGNSSKPIESANPIANSDAPKIEKEQESGKFKNRGGKSLIEVPKYRSNSLLKPTQGFQLILNEAERQRSYFSYDFDW